MSSSEVVDEDGFVVRGKGKRGNTGSRNRGDLAKNGRNERVEAQRGRGQGGRGGRRGGNERGRGGAKAPGSDRNSSKNIRNNKNLKSEAIKETSKPLVRSNEPKIFSQQTDRGSEKRAVSCWANLFDAPAAPATSSSSSSVAEPPRESSGIDFSAALTHRQSSPQSLPFVVQPRGLRNPDTKCFVNASFQALISCRPLIDFVRSLPQHIDALSEFPYWNRLIHFVAEFPFSSAAEVTGTVPQPRVVRHPFTPQYLHETVNEFNPLAMTWQEDAHEYLGFVVERLHQELLRASGPMKEDSTSLSYSENADQGWKEVVSSGSKNKSAVVLSKGEEFERSIVGDIFTGFIQNMVAKRGLPTSSRSQPFHSLLLDIEPPSVTSLSTALDLLVRKEEIEGYRDPETGRIVAATKQSKIAATPPILMISLMRFAWTELGLTKLNKFVEFPTILKMKLAWLAAHSASANVQYRLFAVIHHLGSTAKGGHYVADVRGPSGDWLHCDDERISPIGKERVLASSNAYILFYERL